MRGQSGRRPSSTSSKEENPPDLAVLDVMLPDMDGLALCQKIRENHLFPIIMLTARVEDMDKITGLTLGAVDEINLSGGYFDFEEKYSLKTSAIHCPARISPEKAREIQEAAKTVYTALDCRGFARRPSLYFIPPKCSVPPGPALGRSARKRRPPCGS